MNMENQVHGLHMFCNFKNYEHILRCAVSAKSEELKANIIPFQKSCAKQKEKTDHFQTACLLAKCSQVQNIFYTMCFTK